jgi:hypothetical protein
MSLSNHLTIKEAAVEARVSISLVYQWKDERRFDVYKIGARGRRGKYLIDAVSFRAFLESTKVAAVTPTVPPPVKTKITLDHLTV